MKKYFLTLILFSAFFFSNAQTKIGFNNFVTSLPSATNLTGAYVPIVQNGASNKAAASLFIPLFQSLPDGPGSFTSNGLSFTRVNTGATALEYRTPSQVLSDISGVPTSRTLTINGTAYDLSADRSWTIAGGVTSFNSRTGAITPQSTDYSSFYMSINNPAYTGTMTTGTMGFSDTGNLLTAQSSTNSYNQVGIQNTSNGAAASTNFVVNNDQATATTNYGEFGINSSTFTGSGAWNIAGATYLDAASGDLSIGTLANKTLHFFTNSATTDNLSITGAGALTFNGSTTAIHKEIFSNLSTTQVDGAGIYLQNPTSAGLGAQQIGPSITIEGNGFATTPSQSQVVKYTMDVLPVQGTSNPTAYFRFRQSINGAAASDALQIGLNGSTSQINFPSVLDFQINASQKFRFGSGFLAINSASANAALYVNQSAASSAWVPSFRSDAGAHTAISAVLNARDFEGATWTFADGTYGSAQIFNYSRGFTINKTTTSVTFSSDVYNGFFETTSAGTGVTLTRNWGLGTNGNLQVQGKAYIGAASTAPVEALEVSGNSRANNHINAYTATATAAGTTVLTVASNYFQAFTGTTTQTVTLPVATTLYNGLAYKIINLSTGVVTVQTSGANTIKAMAANSTLDIWVVNTAGGTGTASWNWYYNTSVNN